MAWLPVKNLVLGEFPFWFRPWGRSLVRLGLFWGAEEARTRREARTRQEICILSQPSDKVGVSTAGGRLLQISRQVCLNPGLPLPHLPLFQRA